MSFTNQTIPVPFGWKKNKKKKTLTWKQVRDIKSAKKDMEYYMKKYNRSKSTIQDIQSGRTYSDVK